MMESRTGVGAAYTNLDPAVRLIIEKEPPGSSTHWLIPGPYNGKDEVMVNKSVVGFTRFIYERNVHVRNAVNSFRKHVLKSGFSVSATVGGKTYKFNQENGDTIDYYTNVLLPGVEEIITEWILYGYSVVRIYPPSDEEQFPYFTVMRSHLTEEYIVWDNDRRSYKLVYSGAIPGPLSGKPVPGGMILWFRRPTDQGNPDTELVTTLEPLARQDYIWSQYINATWQAANPSYIFTPEPEKGGDALQGKVSIWGGNAQISGFTEARDEDMIELSKRELSIAQASSIHSQESMPIRTLNVAVQKRQRKYTDSEMQNPLTRIAASINNTPWENGRTSYPGHRLQPAPRSTAPENFLEIQEHIIHQVYRSVGLPPEMLSSSHQKHAANVEQTTAELRANVTEFQGKARAQLRHLFTELFTQLLDAKILSEASAKGKATDVGHLKNEKARASVDFQFEYNPIVTPELLFSYHEQNILKPEKFQEYALMIAGMPQDAAEPDMLKARQKVLDMEAKAKAKAKPPGASGGAGGASGKKRKPAASSSSSSSKKQK